MDYDLFSERKYRGYWKLDGSDPDIRSVYHAGLEFQMHVVHYVFERMHQPPSQGLCAISRKYPGYGWSCVC